LPGTATIAKLLLKARPTPAQLADRFAEPVPEGLELYLDAEDIKDRDEMRRLAERLVALRPNPDFVYVVEGPLRSLDGEFFDLSVNSPANRECLRRISTMAELIGAEAVLVHAITPMLLDTPLSETLRLDKLEASLPLVEHYVETAEECGVMPLLENIPPVARQRQSAFMVTPIGMSAEDLVFFAQAFPGLGVTVDLSHAQLFLNGLRMDPAAVQPELAPLVRYLSTLQDGPSIEEYLDTVGKYLFEVHVSNARGLLEEGLPYGDGDLDLDALAARLGRSARYIVTETIEPDADRGIRMREAQRRLQAALSTIPVDDGEGPAHQEDPV
jgi:sugar phosphate isomerase/epimerase